MHGQRRRIVAAVVAIGAAMGGVSLLAPTSGAVPPYDPDTHETSVTLPGARHHDDQPASAARLQRLHLVLDAEAGHPRR